MTTDIDLSQHPVLDWPQYDWLLSQGVPRDLMLSLAGLRVVKGTLTSQGLLSIDPDGKGFLAFEEYDDVVFWCPATGALVTWNGRAFALGADNIINAGTYVSNGYLTLHPDPIAWLRDRCRGIVIINWNLAFDMLRDAPRIAVSEELLPTYRQHMKPRHMPELAVLASDRRLAA